MTEAEHQEALQIVESLKQDLTNRMQQYEALKKVNLQIEEQLQGSEQRISDLENSLNSQTISLEQLRLENSQIKEDLTGLKKSLEKCQRQNKWLKVTAIIEAVVIAGLLL